mgnify:CR=1 FL=1
MIIYGHPELIPMKLRRDCDVMVVMDGGME